MTSWLSCDFPDRGFFNRKSRMTGYIAVFTNSFFCVFKVKPPFSNFSSVVWMAPLTIACAAIRGREVGKPIERFQRSVQHFVACQEAPFNTSVECSHWLRNVVTYLNSYLSTRFPFQVVHDTLYRECLLQSVTEPDRYVLSTSRCSHNVNI